MVNSSKIIKNIFDQKNIAAFIFILTNVSFSISTLSPLLTLLNLSWSYIFHLGWFFLFLFIIFHAKIVLGAINTVILIIITFILTFILEYMGIQGLIPNCEFYYTGDPAFSVLGEVPVLIPVGWFIIFYIGLIMTYIIFNGLFKKLKHKELTNHPKFLLFGSITAGIIVVSWDLIHDPVAVAYKIWIWKTKGIFFGIPVMNFIGWFVIGFAIYLLFHFYLFKTKKETNYEKYKTSWFIMLPVISYLILLTIDVIHATQINRVELIPVGFVCMSFLIILSCISFVKTKKYD
jgi:uncharacterized membrane protein